MPQLVLLYHLCFLTGDAMHLIGC